MKTPGAGTAPSRPSQHPLVFNGDPPHRPAAYAVRPNRKGVRRPRSTGRIVMFLMLSGAGIVFYIHNILTVNETATEVSRLGRQMDSTLNRNRMLHKRRDSLSARERITGEAARRLGLRETEGTSVWIETDPARLPDGITD
ncbi:MAG: hypothetical protein WB626_06530 [Bacteroidota bacterium]